ncbi:MAG: SUF system NifU family Fe-S cluster assembly protein [Trueperaceae bacterium]|nr:SUF system NifU family Fe-S cluster assembly protein [Trueperaceae bacterium]
MGLLEELYQQAIVEHDRRPHHYGRLEPPAIEVEGNNPSCGDELTLFLAHQDGKVAVSFEGSGCAISRASASMMTDLVAGVDAQRAKDLAGRFRAMMHGEPPDPALGEAVALQGVSKLHARVKCATLAWVTLEEALDRL